MHNYTELTGINYNVFINSFNDMINKLNDKKREVFLGNEPIELIETVDYIINRLTFLVLLIKESEPVIEIKTDTMSLSKIKATCTLHKLLMEKNNVIDQKKENILNFIIDEIDKINMELDKHLEKEPCK